MRKSTFKRLSAAIIVLATAFGLFVFSPSASALKIGTWDLYVSNGEASVTGYLGTESVVSIPSELGGYPVTAISSAFKDCRTLTEVTIPDSVKSIGREAFSGCYSLTGVVIPDSVTSIGYHAFYECSSLTDLTIGNSVVEIDTYAFLGCTLLTDVIIPDSVASMGYGVFARCISLANVTIGNSLTEISEQTFAGCSSLAAVTIPDSVKTVGRSAFGGCTSLRTVTVGRSAGSISGSAFSGCRSLEEINVAPDNRYYKSVNGVLYDKRVTKIVHWPEAKTEIAVPDSVKTIGEYAFAGIASLTDFSIPDSVTGIDAYAFDGCTSLKTLTVHSGVTRIGEGAFDRCSALEGVYIDSIAAWCGISFKVRLQSAALESYYTSANPLVYSHKLFLNGVLVTDLVIPDGVTAIKHAAFYSCSAIKTVTILDSVTDIPKYSLGYLYYEPDNPRKIEGFTVYGYTDTAAQTYAKNNGFEFVSLGYAPHTHEYDDVITAPTCTESGFTTHSCIRCDDVFIDSYVDALGHDFGPGGNSEVCSRCGEKNPDYKPPAVFRDVPADAYYADAVAWAVARGITVGTGEDTFSPDEGCTRGQVVTFLWRAAGSPEPTLSENPFGDVGSSEYYFKAVLWAVENRITSGTGAHTFSPDDVCTRGQIVTFLWRFGKTPEPKSTKNPFSDVVKDDYFFKAVLWAAENGITLGTDATHFSPSDACSRCQIVTFLYRDANN